MALALALGLGYSCWAVLLLATTVWPGFCRRWRCLNAPMPLLYCCCAACKLLQAGRAAANQNPRETEVLVGQDGHGDRDKMHLCTHLCASACPAGNRSIGGRRQCALQARSPISLTVSLCQPVQSLAAGTQQRSHQAPSTSAGFLRSKVSSARREPVTLLLGVSVLRLACGLDTAHNPEGVNFVSNSTASPSMWYGMY